MQVKLYPDGDMWIAELEGTDLVPQGESREDAIEMAKDLAESALGSGASLTFPEPTS